MSSTGEGVTVSGEREMRRLGWRVATLFTVEAVVAAIAHWSAGPVPVIVVTTVVAGVGAGAVLAWGPLRGVLVALACSAVGAALVERDDQALFSAGSGAVVTVVVAVAVRASVGQGFARTERALRAADIVQQAVEVEQALMRSRRAVERRLHDTVLSTLTLLAREDVVSCSEDEARLRSLCRGDVEALDRDGATGERHSSVVVVRSSDPPWSVPPGLEVSVHGVGWPLVASMLTPTAASALGGAVQECLRNVARHAGVHHADVAVGVTQTLVTVVVVDAGRGFDPRAVGEGRLGLRSSVRAAVEEVGGRADVRSAPGRGTSVELMVPLTSSVRQPLWVRR